MTSAQAQATEPPGHSFDLAGYVAAVRRRWKFVAAVTVLGFTAAWFLAPKPGPRIEVTGPPRYQATNTVLQVGSGQLSLDRVKFLATLGEVPRRVAQRIGYAPDPSLLTSEIQVETNPEVGSITFTTTQTTPELAKQLADAWASETLAYVSTVQADALHAQMADIAAQIQQIDEQLAGADVPFRAELTQRRSALVQAGAMLQQQVSGQSQSQSSGLVTVEAAVPQQASIEVPIARSTGKIGRPIWLAGITLMGLVFGVAGAIVLDRLDKRLQTRDSVEDAYDATILAEVPTPRGSRGQPVMIFDPSSPAAEAMRMLRTVLLTVQAGTDGRREVHLEDGHLAYAGTAVAGGGGGRCVLVTSASPGDGKSNTALNLAMALTERQQRVLLVDADLRHADLSEFFGMTAAPGLSDLALSRVGDLQTVAATCRATDNPYLFLLPAGMSRERPSVLLHGVQGVLATARSMVDIVVVDTAALLVANDTRELLGAGDGVLLAVTLGISTAPAAAEARELLERLSQPPLGIALLGAVSGSTKSYARWQRRNRRAAAEALPPAKGPTDNRPDETSTPGGEPHTPPPVTADSTPAQAQPAQGADTAAGEVAASVPEQHRVP